MEHTKNGSWYGNQHKYVFRCKSLIIKLNFSHWYLRLEWETVTKVFRVSPSVTNLKSTTRGSTVIKGYSMSRIRGIVCHTKYLHYFTFVIIYYENNFFSVLAWDKEIWTVDRVSWLVILFLKKTIIYLVSVVRCGGAVWYNIDAS